jgi:hypothetical protein
MMVTVFLSSAGETGDPIGLAHELQNRASPGFSLPQFEHITMAEVYGRG